MMLMQYQMYICMHAREHNVRMTFFVRIRQSHGQTTQGTGYRGTW